MKKLSESKVFAIIVLVFTIIAIAVLAKTVFGDAKKIKNETRVLDTVATKRTDIRILDSLVSKDLEFKKLIDTVIVYQNKVEEKIIQKVVNSDSLNILKVELEKTTSEVNLLTRKLKELRVAQNTIKDTLVKNTYVLVEPGYGKSLDINDFTIQKKSGILNNYHEVKYQDIKIRVISERKFGFSTNLGYGGMYSFDDGRFHHGVYLGVGGYYKF